MKLLVTLTIALGFVVSTAQARGGYEPRNTDDLQQRLEDRDIFPDPRDYSIPPGKRKNTRVTHSSVRCQAQDRRGRKYSGIARGSVNKAVRAAVNNCKRRSSLPRTCRFVKRTCYRVRR